MTFSRRYWSILLVLSGLTALVMTFAVMSGGGFDALMALVLIDGLLVYLTWQDYKIETEDESA